MMRQKTKYKEIRGRGDGCAPAYKFVDSTEFQMKKSEERWV